MKNCEVVTLIENLMKGVWGKMKRKRIIIISIICLFLFNSCAFLNLRIDEDFYKLPKEHQTVMQKKIDKTDSFLRWQHFVTLLCFFIIPLTIDNTLYEEALIFSGIYLILPRGVGGTRWLSDDFSKVKEKLPQLNNEQDRIFKKYADKIWILNYDDAFYSFLTFSFYSFCSGNNNKFGGEKMWPYIFWKGANSSLLFGIFTMINLGITEWQ